MLDLGWSEILVIAIVLIIVVGPKDLPRMLRSFGRTMTKLRSMAGEFRSQFDDALKEAELDDVRQTINSARKMNPARELRDAMNPLKQAGEELRSDLDRTMKSGKPAGAADQSGKTLATKDPAAPQARSEKAAESQSGLNGKSAAGNAAQETASAKAQPKPAPGTTTKAKPTAGTKKTAAASKASGASARKAPVKPKAVRAAPKKTAASKKTGDA
ncbi:Sec-independent protein translocase protein TatB [Pararhizobium haloflavum]|uniref:Sec-independent protein translocase protein TatB n=1 Tax=Pararhizobium haloflavum TaxID=2037914 RepID=UPI000C178E1A|nr:Sec-independent protein translocase protein TatB [Pararhizobium haloflavum]